jgi:pilus assembly protein Flp/PilA
MTGFRATVRRFIADEQGATAIEYALIAAGVGATIASVVWGTGEKVRTNLYDKIGNIL